MNKTFFVCLLLCIQVLASSDQSYDNCTEGFDWKVDEGYCLAKSDETTSCPRGQKGKGRSEGRLVCVHVVIEFKEVDLYGARVALPITIEERSPKWGSIHCDDYYEDLELWKWCWTHKGKKKSATGVKLKDIEPTIDLPHIPKEDPGLIVNFTPLEKPRKDLIDLMTSADREPSTKVGRIFLGIDRSVSMHEDIKYVLEKFVELNKHWKKIYPKGYSLDVLDFTDTNFIKTLGSRLDPEEAAMVMREIRYTGQKEYWKNSIHTALKSTEADKENVLIILTDELGDTNGRTKKTSELFERMVTKDLTLRIANPEFDLSCPVIENIPMRNLNDYKNAQELRERSECAGTLAYFSDWIDEDSLELLVARMNSVDPRNIPWLIKEVGYELAAHLIQGDKWKLELDRDAKVALVSIAYEQEDESLMLQMLDLLEIEEIPYSLFSKIMSSYFESAKFSLRSRFKFAEYVSSELMYAQAFLPESVKKGFKTTQSLNRFVEKDISNWSLSDQVVYFLVVEMNQLSALKSSVGSMAPLALKTLGVKKYLEYGLPVDIQFASTQKIYLQAYLKENCDNPLRTIAVYLSENDETWKERLLTLYQNCEMETAEFEKSLAVLIEELILRGEFTDMVDDVLTDKVLSVKIDFLNALYRQNENPNLKLKVFSYVMKHFEQISSSEDLASSAVANLIDEMMKADYIKTLELEAVLRTNPTLIAHNGDYIASRLKDFKKVEKLRILFDLITIEGIPSQKAQRSFFDYLEVPDKKTSKLAREYIVKLVLNKKIDPELLKMWIEKFEKSKERRQRKKAYRGL